MNGHPTSASSGLADSKLNAQDVLDQTRRELREFLIGEPPSANANKSGKAGKLDASSPVSAELDRSANRNKNVDTIDWMGLVRAGASTWWRDHPLHVAATVLKPVVSDYVRRKPVKMLAIAAASGAALVIVRPWRIASLTALGVSLVRSSNLPVMAASLVASVAEKLQKDQR